MNTYQNEAISIIRETNPLIHILMKPYGLLLLFLVLGPVFASAQEPSFISLQEIGGRSWLIDPGGRPFFAHGVNHFNHRNLGAPVTEAAEAINRFLETWNGNDPRERDLAFLRLIAREYFRVCAELNRKHDPNHLIFGDRFDLRGNIVTEVLEEAAAVVDTIAIQPPYAPGFPKAELDSIHEITGKPIIIADFAIVFKEAGIYPWGGPPVANQKVAGEEYEKFIKAAFSTSYVIGSAWCNPINSIEPFYPPGTTKQGMYGEGLEPRPNLHQSVLELNNYLQLNTPTDATDTEAPSLPLIRTFSRQGYTVPLHSYNWNNVPRADREISLNAAIATGASSIIFDFQVKLEGGLTGSNVVWRENIDTRRIP